MVAKANLDERRAKREGGVDVQLREAEWRSGMRLTKPG
jgi:hypothetical protein